MAHFHLNVIGRELVAVACRGDSCDTMQREFRVLDYCQGPGVDRHKSVVDHWRLPGTFLAGLLTALLLDVVFTIMIGKPTPCK